MATSNTNRLPTPQEAEEAEKTSRALTKYAHDERLHLKVVNGNNVTDDLILPGYALEMLLCILTEMSKGNAVTFMPIHAELTTQEAATILNVSRPHLISLLEQGKLPYHKVGTHRRILAENVFNYKKQIDEGRLKSLNELTVQAQELGMGYD